MYVIMCIYVYVCMYDVRHDIQIPYYSLRGNKPSLSVSYLIISKKNVRRTDIREFQNQDETERKTEGQAERRVWKVGLMVE